MKSIVFYISDGYDYYIFHIYTEIIKSKTNRYDDLKFILFIQLIFYFQKIVAIIHKIAKILLKVIPFLSFSVNTIRLLCESEPFLFKLPYFSPQLSTSKDHILMFSIFISIWFILLWYSIRANPASKSLIE